MTFQDPTRISGHRLPSLALVGGLAVLAAALLYTARPEAGRVAKPQSVQQEGVILGEDWHGNVRRSH